MNDRNYSRVTLVKKQLTLRQQLACEFLLERLEPGVDVRGSDVDAAMRHQGFGSMVINFAVRHLGIKKRKTGIGPGSFWIWTLPNNPPTLAPRRERGRPNPDGTLNCDNKCGNTIESFEAARAQGWYISQAPSGYWLKLCPACQGQFPSRRIVDKEAY